MSKIKNWAEDKYGEAWADSLEYEETDNGQDQ